MFYSRRSMGIRIKMKTRHLSSDLAQRLLESHFVFLNLRFIICRKGIILYD